MEHNPTESSAPNDVSPRAHDPIRPDEAGDDLAVMADIKPDRAVTAVQPVAKTVRGQKYHAPIGRHSQQSHRRAMERAAASGHATSKEQHDHDRTTVKTEVGRVAALKVRQVDNKPK